MFSGVRQLSSQDIRTTSASQQEELGAIGMTSDGRVYRYAKAGAANLALGKLTVNADADANVTNVTVANSPAIGDTLVQVNAGGTIVAGVYNEGYLTVSDATGEGISYKINSNSGVTGAGVITVNLEEQEPLQVALVASTSEVSLTQNPWKSVVISATDQADMATGVPNVNITAAEFGWLQTRGECAAWADEAVTRGLALTIGTGSAGAVEALDAAGEPQIGTASQTLVDTEYRTVYLQID